MSQVEGGCSNAFGTHAVCLLQVAVEAVALGDEVCLPLPEAGLLELCARAVSISMPSPETAIAAAHAP